MNVTDSLLLEFLAARASFAAHQVEHLRDWWRAGSEPDEALSDFLRRQDLLSESAMQILRQMSRGHLTDTMGFALLDPAELDTLRRKLPEMAGREGGDDLFATVTLLAGDDTSREGDAPVNGDSEPPRVGGKLGKYLLTEWVAQGSSGIVFRALHPTLHIPVAIKVLNADGGYEADLPQRLKSEARMLACLNHPNIVRVYDFEVHPRFPFLVLEHVNGPSLAELIEQSGRVQPHRVVRIIRQLAEGLAAAHALGIVHRDIKPANILLTRTGEVKLADLGLATMRANSGGSGAGLGRPSSRAGTACYLAPELVGTNAPADERSDMYSLGATFFHALTGEPPFLAERCWQVLEHHAKTPPPNPSERVPSLPADLSNLVCRMLAKSPSERPESFADLLRETALNRRIAAIAEERDQQQRPTPLWQRILGRVRKRESRWQTA
jgi:hypothetical protein